MDETLKLKLNISRDVHSEFMRKVLGKGHYETVFGDHSLPSIYASSSRDSFQDNVSPKNSSYSLTSSSSNVQNNCPNSTMMSVFEFCVVCDNNESPRRHSIPNGKQEDELNRKFTFSSLLTEVNDYSAIGSTPESSLNASRSTVGSPLREPRGSFSNNSVGTMNLHQGPLMSSSSSSQNSPSKLEKELFDGMIRLEASRAFDDISFKSGSHNQLMLNIASISTRLDDSCFHGVVETCNGSNVSSSLSTPTVASQSPNLSRSTSDENILLGRECDSFYADSIVSDHMPPRHLYPQHSYPFSTSGSRHPVVAKRTPKIEKMISEVKQRANSPSHSPSPRIGNLSRSVSASHSQSFYDHNGLTAIQSMSLQSSSSSLILDGIAGNENKYVINNPHTKNRSKPLYSLFPTSATKKSCKSGSNDTIQAPPVPRLTSEEMIQNRKLMARKMRDVSLFSSPPNYFIYLCYESRFV